jgi:long-chain acyl-CoA synthetase
VSPQLRARIRERFRSVGSRVGSLYGFTEAGGAVAAGSGDDVTERPGTVGRALPAVELTVRAPDEDGVGEIGVRTPSAARGYLGDPEPLADPDGWIYSGDLGRIDDEGWLYVTGRRKEIVIRGGENVSSVHVEEALLAHPAVQEVAVVGLPHEDLGEEVGAAVVLHAGADVDAGALRTFARRNLGGYEVPTAWWFRTDPLPTGDSGKILRRRVREEWVAAQTEDTHG